MERCQRQETLWIEVLKVVVEVDGVGDMVETWEMNFVGS